MAEDSDSDSDMGEEPEVGFTLRPIHLDGPDWSKEDEDELLAGIVEINTEETKADSGEPEDTEMEMESTAPLAIRKESPPTPPKSRKARERDAVRRGVWKPADTPPRAHQVCTQTGPT